MPEDRRVALIRAEALGLSREMLDLYGTWSRTDMVDPKSCDAQRDLFKVVAELTALGITLQPFVQRARM